MVPASHGAVTATATVLVVVELLPSWPLPSSPQQYALPPATTQVCA